ncbi:hypothetical protein CBF34_03375 [Vagococcus penaei]|uniref:Uncharacterized protein n=1 Tax=Vagococcus penaei TaxID=633807 RepID=A0A1Q2D7H2_9ENTE|nr:aromatic acid exporter family protein [Vagococcus penaei]AQP54302.1 hypothetical protein BW732_08760 [Vagococcus penaei]RSU05811.1 hypothetical protein CBF34_03375 [Vagococcus penaei]
MHYGRFHLGLRTLKTALAVMACIIFFHLTDRGSPMVATLSAVFALREDLPTTIDFGKSRILGNTVGGLNAFFYYLLHQEIANKALAETLLIPLFVALTIIISISLNNQAGIIGGVATLLFITFSIPKDESFLYAFHRVIDTFIGTFFAISMNYVIKSPLEDKTETIHEKLVKISNKEKEIEQLKQEIKELKK